MSHFPDQPIKTSSGSKVFMLLAICSGIAFLLCCGGGVGIFFYFRQGVSEDPAEVRAVAKEITDIEVPAGYDPAFSMNVFGISMAAFGDKESDSGRLLMLMAFPNKFAGDETQMQQQMQQNLEQQRGKQSLEHISSETRKFQIRGKETMVRIAKVKNNDGQEFRQATCMFVAQGERPATLMVMMPEEEWTNGGEAKLEAMFKSMK